ncbi:hypothetical protein [Priestia aryabhattai]
MLNIDWEEVKYRILRRFVLDFPFVKIVGLLNFDIKKYIISRHLMSELDQFSIENALNFAFEKTFKMIGMKVDVNMFFCHQLKEINEIKSLLFFPTMTFDLEAGLNFSIVHSNLHSLKREQLLKCIEELSVYFTECDIGCDMPIDIIFGDEDYLRNRLFKLRISDVVQKKMNYLSNCIDRIYIQRISEKMKQKYVECIQQEIRNYLSETFRKKDIVK